MQNITDERLLHERALFKRLVLAFQDLIESRGYFDLLLARGDESPPSGPSVNERDALVTSLVVSYGRCFTDSRTNDGTLSRLPGRFERVFSVEERRLHDRLIELRNTEFAHSDEEAGSVTVTSMKEWNSDVLLPETRVLRRYSLPNSELASFPKLVEKVYASIYDEMHRLYSLLSPHGHF